MGKIFEFEIFVPEKKFQGEKIFKIDIFILKHEKLILGSKIFAIPIPIPIPPEKF